VNHLVISPSPHRRAELTTQKIMAAVNIALLPAAGMGVYLFGISAFFVLITCIASCVLFEILCYAAMKRSQKVYDLSAILTGLLLGMNLPPDLPLYIAIIGSFIAIVIVKQLFGGIGQNFANPAITARIVLMLSFTPQMTRWVVPLYYKGAADAATGATPLAAEWLTYEAGGELYKMAPFTLQDMFFGYTGGCIGETSAALLILGGLTLIALRVVFPITPTVYLSSFALLTFIWTRSINETLYQLLAGGLMLGAFFMATDYTTAPLTSKGRVVFALGCGIVTFLIRQFGGYPEGVSFAILFMNLLTPYIDRVTRTVPLGTDDSDEVKPNQHKKRRKKIIQEV